MLMQILKTIEQISTKSQSTHLSEQHFPMYHTDIWMYGCGRTVWEQCVLKKLVLKLVW